MEELPMPEWFLKGGLVMWPLLACSIVAVAIILERIWALQRRRIISSSLVATIETTPTGNDHAAKIKTQSETDSSVLGELVSITFKHATVSKAENVEAVQAAARQTVGRLERGLTTLSLIVEISPLLGLLGTVLGMVRLFTDVAEMGLGDPKAIASGIFEALITTVAGLAVAIPALIAFMYLRRRIETLALELERHINEVLTRLYRD
jgi:biopolymer transport protein ExbB